MTGVDHHWPDTALLAEVEAASLRASEPPEQQLLDGWIVRTSPGKAQRARSVNAVSAGLRPLDEKLALASAAYCAAGLPLLIRITPFSAPAGLDQDLAGRGWPCDDETCVLVRRLGDADRRRGSWPRKDFAPPVRIDTDAFAEAVGVLRGSPPMQRLAHARRLAASPTPYAGWVVRDDAGAVVCCGQSAADGRWVGLYDIHTATAHRGRRLAGSLCEHMLSSAARTGAEVAYLQVASTNASALAIYRRLGFVDGYRYHYRYPPG